MSAVMTAEAREGLITAMESCDQMPGLSVLAHGEMVRDYYRDLIGHLRDGKPLAYEWRLPEWIHDPLVMQSLPDDGVMSEYHLFHDVVIDTPPNASTDCAYRPSRLRVKTIMTITDADQDESPDLRSMIMAATLMREMKHCCVEPDVTFNHEGGVHLSWTGSNWEIEAGIEHDGHFDWVRETQDGAISQSDGLVTPQDAVTTVQRLIASIIQHDTKPMPAEGLVGSPNPKRG